MRGKNQSGPSWTGVVRHLESVHNVRTEEEEKISPGTTTIEG